jgi:hypothetical protein
MPTYIPTITTFTNGVVTVESTDGTSYQSILNSMGSFVYGVNGLYVKANSNNQILEGFTIEQYDVNGYIKSFKQNPLIDPYQYQKSVFFKLAKENVFLNGQTTFDLKVLPSEIIYMNIYVTQISVIDYLSGSSLLDNDFFKNFNDVL